jgi:hypothetical protein
VTNEEKFENIKVEIRSRKLKDRHHNWKKKISLIQKGQTMAQKTHTENQRSSNTYLLT